MTLDPVRNPRYLMCVLRQAGVFTGLYLLIETVLLLGLLVSAGAGTRLGPALRVELNSLWLIALVLAIPFWLIPVPALLAEWSRVLEQGADATKTAFEHINSAFQAQGTPVDSLRVRAASRREKEIVNTWSCAATISAATSHVLGMGTTCTWAGPSGCTCPPCGC